MKKIKLAQLTIKDDHLKRVLDGNAFLLFDGAFGTELQKFDVDPSLPAEFLNETEPDTITAIHSAYVEAGSNVVTTNTFRANRPHLGENVSVSNTFKAAVACARAAHPHYVAADIGPLDEMLEPSGDLEPEDAYQLFAEQARAAQSAGADFILIETIADLQEAILAVRACKAESTLPVFVTMTFSTNGRTFMGATPEDAAHELTEAGADAVGINCSLGPLEIVPLLKTMREHTTLPLIAQANAGLPHVNADGSTSYPFSVDEYAQGVDALIEAGATIIGGCCGTDPRYIAALRTHLS